VLLFFQFPIYFIILIVSKSGSTGRSGLTDGRLTVKFLSCDGVNKYYRYSARSILQLVIAAATQQLTSASRPHSPRPPVSCVLSIAPPPFARSFPPPTRRDSSRARQRPTPRYLTFVLLHVGGGSGVVFPVFSFPVARRRHGRFVDQGDASTKSRRSLARGMKARVLARGRGPGGTGGGGT